MNTAPHAPPAHLAIVHEPEAWREEMRRRRGSERRQVGIVPTMGALHAGHLSLIRRARADCDVVGVSVYVNPLQFGAGEDLSSYPRDLETDRRLAAEAGADVLFAPTPQLMWPERPGTTVRVTGLSDRFEGRSRPGHFDGVATIVAKLLALTGDCFAYFGEKDFQQLAVVRKMVADLSLPSYVIACPTVRDSDGLALSSRNAYLTPEQRAVAPSLYWSLLAGKRAIEEDRVTDPAAVAQAIEASLSAKPLFEIDYAGVADPDDLTTPVRITGPVRLLVAARLGRARLIDNVLAIPQEASR